jgi:anti-sigma B factor antagonist
MRIEVRIVDDTAIVALSGNRIPLDSEDQSVTATIKDLLDQGHRKIVLNIEDVPVVDSEGLGDIVRAYTTVSAAGGTLRLEGVHERMRDLFARTGLARFLESGSRPLDPISPDLHDVNWPALVVAGVLLLILLVTMLWKMGPRL